MNVRSQLALAILATCVSLAWSSSAFAQSGTAAIGGRVTDQQGLVLPGVTVAITNAATGDSRSTVTNETGRYLFTAMPPGTYVLTIELAGFRSLRYENVALRVDTEARRDAQLEIGNVA
jgi:hypothetical protein